MKLLLNLVIFTCALGSILGGYFLLQLRTHPSAMDRVNPAQVQLVDLDQTYFFFQPTLLSLGLVHTNQVIKTNIKIQNKTSNVLTIKKIHEHCPCFRAHTTQQTIAPNELLTLELNYFANYDERDESKSVDIEFTDRNLPPHSIELRCLVRSDLALLKSSVSEPAIPVNATRSHDYFVGNFTSSPWDSIQLHCDQSWIHFSDPIEIPVPEALTSCLQAWKFTLSINGDISQVGKSNTCYCKITSSNHQVLPKSILIQSLVTSKLRASRQYLTLNSIGIVQGVLQIMLPGFQSIPMQIREFVLKFNCIQYI